MRERLDPNAGVNIPCPQCAQKSEYTVGLLETSPRLRCPTCGVLFKVDAAKILARVKEAAARIEAERRRRGV